MTTIKKTVLITGIFSQLWCATLYAAPHDDTVDHKAHVHGLAALTLAIEGQQVALHFESPAVNIVGFEHKAETHKQKSAVTHAQSILESEKNLFTFLGSNCSLADININLNAITHTENNEHHHNHYHKDEYNDTHSEVNAAYHLTCQNAEKIIGLTVNLFNSFPAIEKIKVLWVTENKQGAIELTANENTLYFKK